MMMMPSRVRCITALKQLIYSSFSGRHRTISSTAGNVITCLAAVARGPNQPLEIEEIEVDPPQRMEVRLKILYTSVCHTDLNAWQSLNEAHRAFPRILGHEAVGVVESVGEGVNDVGAIFNGECGDCVYCRRHGPPTNLCQHFRVDPRRAVMRSDSKCRFRSRVDGGQIYHFINTSTFSQYTVLDSACVVNLTGRPPLALPLSTRHLKIMSLFSCCVSTGVGAAWNAADVQPGSSVAIFGLGALGLAVSGSNLIMVAGIPRSKAGKAMGITDFINPMETSKPVHEGWGKTVLVGIDPSPQLLPLHSRELFAGRTITGTVFGGFRPKSQLHHLANRCLQPDMNLEELITHELPFENINDAFQLLLTGKSLRCLLHF
ncbi:Alcohol dehydrogenase-like 3 [Linum grandiflorum]